MITKNLYKECVQSIIDFNDDDHRIYEATNGLIDTLNWDALARMQDMFCKLLEYCTKDCDEYPGGTDLGYFLYELNGGKDYETNSITDADGKEVPCRTIDDLWNNFIISAHPEVEDKSEKE